SFLNKAELLEILESAPDNSKITIDGTVNESMDHDVEEVINSFADRAEDKKIELELTGMNA
ncbi:MAG: SulP family inorganic anion transporter, partial [Flavobacteriia bacterium]|nr:SulP family inorganic anion transporter [Flavobacteriia bacterium]